MRHTTILSIGVAAMLALAGCSTAARAGSPAATSVGSGASQTGSPGTDGQGGRFGGFPGVSGLVAEVTGSTAQVQTPASQTAVSWTAKTRFTQQRSTVPTNLKVGDCVIALPAAPASAGGSTSAPTTPGANRTPTSVAAATVEIFPAASTGCGFGARPGGNGTRRSGSAGTATSQPSGIPTPRPSFTGDPRNGGRFGATGTVTALAASSFTVRSTRSPAGAGQDVTVTWSSTTHFTALKSASSAAVKVGVCLSATGKPDSTGAVTATTVTVSDPINGSCRPAGAFGRGRPGSSSTTAATLNG